MAATPTRVGMVWQPAGWIGAQVGGTLWLLLLAAVLMQSHPAAAAVAGMSFVVANLLGWRLWRRRATMSARNGTLILLAVECAAGLLSLIACDSAGALDGVVGPSSATAYTAGSAVYLNLLVYPAVGLVIWNVDRMLRKRPPFRLDPRATGPRAQRPRALPEPPEPRA